MSGFSEYFWNRAMTEPLPLRLHTPHEHEVHRLEMQIEALKKENIQLKERVAVYQEIIAHLGRRYCEDTGIVSVNLEGN